MAYKRKTTDRTHWAQGMCDIRIRPNLSWLSNTEKEIAKNIWQYIPQYRKASVSLARTWFYTISNFDYSQTLYTLDDKNGARCLGTTTKHRIKEYIRMYQSWELEGIDRALIENYLSGWHTTAIWLLRASKIKEREDAARRMARSHADYSGSETGDSKIDHQNRVAMRSF